MRDFEDNLEAEGLYKLNTTYHGSGLEVVYSFYDSTIIFHHKQTKQRRRRSGSSARDMSCTFITSLTTHDI